MARHFFFVCDECGGDFVLWDGMTQQAVDHWDDGDIPSDTVWHDAFCYECDLAVN